MLQLRNDTPFASTVYLIPDAAGVDCLFTVLKATFNLEEDASVAEQQVPIAMADEFLGDPTASSIKVSSDISLMKQGTDVLLMGSAYAPKGRRTTQMDVVVSAGSLSRTIRVFGDRRWESRFIGYEMSSPVPFETMPLIWERAFGGTDRKGEESLGEARNPIGAGFRSRRGDKALDGLPLPNLESPGTLIGSWKDRPTPLCYGPIPGHWEPRKSWAGTYDDHWQRSRAPYLPTDFDHRYCQVAPPGLVSTGFLAGGTSIEVRGATPDGRVVFRLPSVRVEVTYLLDRTPQVEQANLDTVLLEPDERRVVLVWRAALRCDKKALRVNEVRPVLLKAA
jgi:hypothetical protein